MVTLKDRLKQLNELKQLTEKQSQFVPPPADESSHFSAERIEEEDEVVDDKDTDGRDNLDKEAGKTVDDESPEETVEGTPLEEMDEVATDSEQVAEQDTTVAAGGDITDSSDHGFSVEEPKGDASGHDYESQDDGAEGSANNNTNGARSNDGPVSGTTSSVPPPQEGTKTGKGRSTTSNSNRDDTKSRAVQCIIAVLCLIALGVSLYFLLPVITDETTPSTQSSVSTPTTSPGDPGFSPTVRPQEPSEPSPGSTLSPVPTSYPTLKIQSLPIDGEVMPSAPTGRPTKTSVTPAPSRAQTEAPTGAPTKTLTKNPTIAPTMIPTKNPTITPTGSPTFSPTVAPVTPAPTENPTFTPTVAPVTLTPTKTPTAAPTRTPTATPTTPSPTKSPTGAPTKSPTKSPTRSPSTSPTTSPPTKTPTVAPTKTPTATPTKIPTESPSTSPPTKIPTRAPSKSPTRAPTVAPVTPAPTKGPLEVQLESISGEGALENPRSARSVARNVLLREGLGSRGQFNDRELERYVAAVFYFSTGGDDFWYECFRGHTYCGSEQWFNGDVCNWRFISCNSDGFITSIVIDKDNGLRSSIPMEIWSLPFLEVLEIVDNSAMSGPLPTKFGEIATNMVLMRVENSGLTGTIPNGFLANSPLEFLYLQRNRLSGTIPNSVGLLTSLNELTLHRNLLTGGVPQSVCTLRGNEASDLQVLAVDCNEVSCSCCTTCY